MDQVLKSMDFDFFGAGKHKIELEKLFAIEGAVFLDVRSVSETESVHLGLKHHIEVAHIPANEIPERIAEIPRDKTIGIFCTSGTRSAIVYAYLRAKGYENVRIAPGGYDAVTNLMMPGKLFKRLQAGNGVE